MKARFIILIFVLCASFSLQAQLISDTKTFTGGPAQAIPSNPGSRSAQNPKACTGDTSYFPNYGTTAYRSVTVRQGSSLGQYFGANQNITVSGFRFYGYALSTNPARKYTIRLICNMYKAGVDSLPTGVPLASDTIEVDTVMGSNILLSRITREAVFANPVTVNYGYIITVESDSANVSAAIVTNSWLGTTPDGRKKNLGCGSVSGKWYRCLQLNIGGVTFDSDMQLYPFVKYSFGADFSVVNDCYNLGDTVKFNNQWENNVSSMPYYNYYLNYNLGYFTQRWSYDGSSSQSYIVDGFYKPSTRKNFEVRLIGVVYSYSSGQCYDTANQMVYFTPAKPQLKSPLSACKGDTVTLNVGGDAGVVFNWYNSPSDNNPFYTGTGYLIENVQENDTFYVQAVNQSCKSAFLRIDFRVLEYPSDPIVKNDSICQGAVANLKASTSAGKLEWYSAPTGGSLVFTGTDLQTGKLLKDSSLYILANNGGCLNPSGRIQVSAFVSNNFAPDKPIVGSDTFVCLRPAQKAWLYASQNGTDTLRWFDVSTGGKPLTTGDSFLFTPTFRGDDARYVETWNGVCGSGRSAITVHVYDYPEIFGLRGDTICNGDSARMFLSVPWGTALWFDKKDDTNPIATGKTPTFGGLSSSRKYYVTSEENGCRAPHKDSVEVLVYTPPVPTVIKADAVCAKSLGAMEVQVPYGKVNWYYEATDQIPFSNSNVVNAGLLLSNVTYYYETEYKGCVTPKTPLTITIKPRPTAGFTWTLQWQNRLVCTPITTAGLTLQWNWGDGKITSGAPYVHQYETPGQYTVRLVATSNANGCKDTADIPVNIDHTGLQHLNVASVTLFPVPAQKEAVVQVSLPSPSPFIVHFSTVDGRTMYMANGGNRRIVLPAELMPGLYLVRIQQGENRFSAKLLISE